MSADASKTACAIEPVRFEGALYACLDQRSPLDLYALEGLSLLSDAVVLFDELIFLNTTTPTIRHANSPKGRSDTAQEFLEAKLKWGFVTSAHLIDYPNSDWFYGIYRARSKEEYRIEQLDKHVFRRHKITDPTIGNRSWSEVMYLDKVSNASALLGAAVAHSRDTIEVFKDYYWPPKSLSVDFFQHYESLLRERILQSRLGKFREINHFSPYFLSTALNDTGLHRPQDLLLVLEQMRGKVTHKYRELCNELLVKPELQSVKIIQEIESVLGKLAQADSKVPSAYGAPARTAISVFKLIGAFVKFVKGDDPDPVKMVEMFKDLFGVSQDFKKIVSEDERYSMYVGLSFFNRVHFDRPSADFLFCNLKRVFGEVDFTKEDLGEFLSGKRIVDIYKKP